MSDATPSAPPSPAPAPLPWRGVAVALVAGLLLRLALLALAGETTLQKDESGYLYLALAWERFGLLLDAERYLWPPAWPFVLKTLLGLFGAAAPLAARVLECGLSVAIGAGVASLAGQLGGPRAARIGAWGWALHLPLAAFTHYLWSEPLFLALLVPSLALVARGSARAGRGAGTGELLAAGLLFGLALLTREVALYLGLLLALGLLLSGRAVGLAEGLRRSSLFLLAAAAVVAPWTARNHEQYGRLVPVGISLGENVYHGLNSRYVNFDLAPLARSPRVREPLEQSSRAAFTRTDPAGLWRRAEDLGNTADRSAEHTRRGLAWLVEHPADFARTRIKKLADLVAPTSFFVRHQALEAYGGPLGEAPLRPLLVVLAVASAALLVLAAVPGLVHLALRLPTTPGAWVPLVATLYFTGTSLLVSMSRFRAVLEPWWLVVAAVLLAASPASRLPGRAPRLVTLAGLGALGFLWWVDLPELSRILELALTR